MGFPAITKLLQAAVIVISVQAALADTLVLRDGQRLSGRIAGETPDTVVIEASSGRFTFPRSQVKQVLRESSENNYARDMEQYLATGKIDAAMVLYQESGLASSMSDDALADSFTIHLKNAANGAVATTPTAYLLAQKFRGTSTAPSELLVLTAAFFTDSRQFDEALSLLRVAEQRAATGSPRWPAETTAALLDRIGTAAVQNQQGALLASSAALASRLPLQAKSKPNYLAAYGHIEDLIRRNEHLLASSQFHPDMFLHRADLFIPLAERLITAVLAAPNSTAVAPVLESARSTVLPYIDSSLKLRALKRLVTSLIDDGRETDAKALADEISAKDADTGALLVHLVEFRQRRAKLPADSPLEVYKLAAWAKSMGLLDESEALFLSLRNDPRFSETVNLQLEIIDHTQAVAAVRRLRTLYDLNSIVELKREAAEFFNSAPPEKYAQEARDLLQLVDFEKWSSKRSSYGRAEAEFQQAERLANRGEYDQALTHLNQIQMDRQDSAAAHKATALRDRIMKEKLKLEQKAMEAKLRDSAP